VARCGVVWSGVVWCGVVRCTVLVTVTRTWEATRAKYDCAMSTLLRGVDAADATAEADAAAKGGAEAGAALTAAGGGGGGGDGAGDGWGEVGPPPSPPPAGVLFSDRPEKGLLEPREQNTHKKAGNKGGMGMRDAQRERRGGACGVM